MLRKVVSGTAIVLCIALGVSGGDKEEKTYELIYKDVQLLKKQFLEISSRLEKNTDEINAVKKQITEILVLSRQFQAEQRSLRQGQERLPTQIQIILDKLENVARGLSSLSEEVIELKSLAIRPAASATEPKAETAEEETPPDKQEKTGVKEEGEENLQEGIQPPSVKPNLAPREVYSMAHSDYLKGNYSLAIDGFKIYIEQFPDSPYADNALYWIGECYFSQREFEKAIEQFQNLILTYPQGDKVPPAYLKRGISLMELGKKDEALAVFKLLVSKFPLEDAAKIAQQKIKEIEQ